MSNEKEMKNKIKKAVVIGTAIAVPIFVNMYKYGSKYGTISPRDFQY